MMFVNKGASDAYLAFQAENEARNRIALVMKRFGVDLGPMRMADALDAIAERLEEYEALRDDGK